jgi:hypothetical protein
MLRLGAIHGDNHRFGFKVVVHSIVAQFTAHSRHLESSKWFYIVLRIFRLVHFYLTRITAQKLTTKSINEKVKDVSNVWFPVSRV